MLSKEEIKALRDIMYKLSKSDKSTLEAVTKAYTRISVHNQKENSNGHFVTHITLTKF